MYAKINITGTIILVIVALLFLMLTSCAKRPWDEDTLLNAHVAQVEAEKALWDANELAKR